MENLYWSEFENEAERENNGRQFVQLVQEQLAKPAGEVSHCCQASVHGHTVHLWGFCVHYISWESQRCESLL